MNLCNIPQRIRAKPAVSNPNPPDSNTPWSFGYAQLASSDTARVVATERTGTFYLALTDRRIDVVTGAPRESFRVSRFAVGFAETERRLTLQNRWLSPMPIRRLLVRIGNG
jgi:hypothetical protein